MADRTPIPRKIVRLGDPVLRSPAAAVTPQLLAQAETQELIDDMIDTMRHAGGVGLAAPQIGVGLQIFVYEVAGEEGESPEIPLRVLVNPMVEPETEARVEDWEGCLSIPQLRGLVPRHPNVKVHALDRDGRPVSLRAADFEARIIQHEFDHLNGIVFLDRMQDLRSLSYEDELQHYEGDEDESVEHAAVG